MTYIKTFFAFMIPLVVIDSLWLAVIAKGFYAKHLGFLMTKHPVWSAIILFYILYSIAVVFFVITPALAGNLPWYQVLPRGAFFGFIAYATYDLTNHATIAHWPLVVTVVDIAWGAIVTGAATTIGYFLMR